MAILCDHLILREKYSMIIRQVKLYGLEYWAIKEHDSKMSMTDMRMLRWMTNKLKEDKKLLGVNDKQQMETVWACAIEILVHQLGKIIDHTGVKKHKRT